MAVKVTVTGKSGKQEFTGDNVTIEGEVLKVWREPHEVKPEGAVDIFMGEGKVLLPGDVFKVREV